MRGKTISWRFLILGGLMPLCILLVVIEYGYKKNTGKLVFNLDEISTFDVEEKLLGRFIRGQYGDCAEQPEAEVGAYPTFTSDKPLYGSVWFAGEYGEESSGTQYHFAVDESAGTGKGYDLLYFDLNRDLDLTNDTPLVPLKSPPDGALLKYSSIKQQVCFDYLKVNFDFGSNGQRPLEIMPRLTVSDSGYTSLSFVTTKARKGKIRIAGHRFNILLGHNYLVGGWFDRPSTALHLIPKDASRRSLAWWGGDRLMAIHKIQGTHYRFSATPAGDKLFVQPYEGDFGTFEVGAGERDIQEMTMRGSLRSKDTAVAVGGKIEHGWPEPVKSCRLPVGDYLPTYLRITFGKLSIFISNNYHADGKPRDRAGRPQVYGINVRKDKSFILDFSNKAEVMFASPAEGHRIKLGEELTVKAILTDPNLDIMIRDLEDSTRRHWHIGPDGKPSRHETFSVDPNVVITRADGQKVAEGVMPFG